MPDREKVIKSVDICLGNGHCADCHYCLGRAGITTMDCRKYLLTDVLALLKEQEPLKPKKVRGYNPPIYTIYEYECEKCQSPIMNKQPFCMGCGRRVVWNDGQGEGY